MKSCSGHPDFLGQSPDRNTITFGQVLEQRFGPVRGGQLAQVPNQVLAFEGPSDFFFARLWFEHVVDQPRNGFGNRSLVVGPSEAFRDAHPEHRFDFSNHKLHDERLERRLTGPLVARIPSSCRGHQSVQGGRENVVPVGRKTAGPLVRDGVGSAQGFRSFGQLPLVVSKRVHLASFLDAAGAFLVREIKV